MAARRLFDFAEYDAAPTAHQRNRVLFEWLCDDDDRSKLFDKLRASGGSAFEFPGRAPLALDPNPPLLPPREPGPAKVHLLLRRDDVEYALTHPEVFGNLPYAAIGSGDFMLALPAGEAAHRAQRAVAEAAMLSVLGQPALLAGLATAAVDDAAVLALARNGLDMASWSWQAGLRLCMLLFGYASSDFGLVAAAAEAGYRALTYQLWGRHFVSEPGTVPRADQALAALAQRSDELMNEYLRRTRYADRPPGSAPPRAGAELLPEGVRPLSERGLSGLTPLLRALALEPQGLDGQSLAVAAVGMLVGIVGNVQACACIALDHLLRSGAVPGQPVDLPKRMAEAWQANPPVAFLGRWTLKPAELPSGGFIPAGRDCVLALGAATRDLLNAPPARPQAPVDPLVFGGAPRGTVVGAHWCFGDALAWVLVKELLERAWALPQLARAQDPIDATPLPLRKRWGFACESLPLVYRREQQRLQQPLQVIMRIKSPVSENAEQLKRVIAAGAPLIERSLRQARHVHFAWFQLVDNDTKLALQTVYDGDFDAYIQHFALRVDDLFDELFKYLESAPPTPVRANAQAFVETIRRFNVPPLGGYFFSAYPRVGVSQVLALDQAPGLTP